MRIRRKLPKNAEGVWLPSRLCRKIEFGSVFTRVCWTFAPNFREKKASRSSRLVLGVRSHGPTGCKIGAVHTCLPVWRELKLAWVVLMTFRSTVFTRAFPFEGNWNENCYKNCYQRQFTRAFPFEGNWNGHPFLKVLEVIVLFTRAFPFEGNWNYFFSCVMGETTFPCSPVPSRLKGIETPAEAICLSSAVVRVHTCLPVWRELKHVFAVLGFNTAIAFSRSHVPSRLKGIETSLIWWMFGNMLRIHTCLPVWRE